MKTKMKTLLYVLLMLLLVPIAPVSAAPAAGLTDADVTAIKKHSAAWVKAAQAGDWNTMVAVYAEDALYLPEQAPMLQGRAAIRGDFDSSPKMTDLTVVQLEIDGRGDLAFARGTFSFTMAPEAGARPVTVTGKYIEIWKKQADGQWRIVRDIWNTNGQSGK